MVLTIQELFSHHFDEALNGLLAKVKGTSLEKSIHDFKNAAYKQHFEVAEDTIIALVKDAMDMLYNAAKTDEQKKLIADCLVSIIASIKKIDNQDWYRHELATLQRDIQAGTVAKYTTHAPHQKTKKTLRHSKDKRSYFQKHAIQYILLLLIPILFFVVLVSLPAIPVNNVEEPLGPTPLEQEIQQVKEQTPTFVDKEIPQRISFYNTITNKDSLHRSTIVFLGIYEYRELSDGRLSTFIDIVKDDDGRTLLLKGLTAQSALRMRERSDEGVIYNITGYFNKWGNYDMPSITVSSMQEVARPTKIVREEITK